MMLSSMHHDHRSTKKRIQRALCCVLAPWLAALSIGASAALGQADNGRTGVELAGRSPDDPPLSRWRLRDAKTHKDVASTDGKWGFVNLPAGTYELFIRPMGSATEEVQWDTIKVEPGKVTQIAIRCGIELLGRSKDEPPLENWYVYQAGTKKRVARTYQRWGFTPLPPGEYTVAVVPPGSSAEECEWTKVNVEASKVVSLRIDSGIELLGRSKDESPLADWYVYQAGTRKRVARAYQHWGFTPLPAGEYTVALVPQGSAAEECAWANIKVEASRVVSLKIDSGIELLGRSKDEPPLEDWYVYEAWTKKRAARSYQHWGFTPLPPGEYTVAVVPQGASAQECEWLKVKVEASKVVSVKIDSGIELLGRSKDEPPLEDWYVYEASTKKHVARSYQHWGFTPLPPGEYSVVVVPQGASADECEWTKVKVEPSNVVTAKIDSGIELLGRSKDEPPLEDWYIYEAGTKKRAARSYQHWGFTPLPSGKYSLVIVPMGADARECKWSDFEVRSEGVTTVRIDSGVELTGRSTDESPLQDWYLYDLVTNQPAARTYQRWGFTPVPPGNYALTIIPQGADALELRWQELKVEAGKTIAIAIRSGIEVVSDQPAKAPPQDWYVKDNASKEALARVYQRWGFTPMAPGGYLVEALHDPEPFTTTVKLDADQIKRLVLTDRGFVGNEVPAPATASTVVRATPGDTVIELAWDPPQGLEVAGYRVYRSGSNRPIHGEVLLTSPKFVDLGLSNGREYHYRIVAVQKDGSEWKGYQEADVKLPAVD